MKPIILTMLVLGVAFRFATPDQAWGQWTAGGVPVCQAYGDQSSPKFVSDGAWDDIIIWMDSRGGSRQLYAARITDAGTMPWPTGGVCLSSHPVEKSALFSVMEDGQGGAIIAWVHDSTIDVHAQRIDAGGNLLWGSDGIVVNSPGAMWLENISATSDGVGGAIVVWENDPDGTLYSRIYAQRINASGALLWPAGGVLVGDSDVTNKDSGILSSLSDGSGGGFFLWRRNNTGMHAQRIDGAGNLPWGAGGITVSIPTTQGGGTNPRLVSDGVGGVLAFWDVFTAVFGQRLSGSGVPAWTVGGERCASVTFESPYQVVSDGSGGAFLGYHGDDSVYVQHIDISGNPMWIIGGVHVGSSYLTATEISGSIVRDGSDGMILAWSESNSDGTQRLLAQRLNANGSKMWIPSGVVLGDGYDSVESFLTSDGAGGVKVAWSADFPDARGTDVYVQHINADGEWTDNYPDLIEIIDVPNDQGGQVLLTWSASGLESTASGVITQYSIWRRYGPATKVNSPASRTNSWDPDKAGWEQLGQMAVHGLNEYSYAASTLCDSVPGDPGFHHFFVSAHTNDPLVFFDSPADSCYSIDNLAPAAVKSLAAQALYDPPGLRLSWESNEESDLGDYRVYRKDPGKADWTLFGSTESTAFVDETWSPVEGCSYAVVAADVHANEGAPVEIGPADISGIGNLPGAVPVVLRQNYPNPFNPATTIAFDVPAGTRAELKVFDVTGRLVQTLFDAETTADRTRASWAGLDLRGKQVASGLYFYRVRAAGYSATKRMVLVK